MTLPINRGSWVSRYEDHLWYPILVQHGGGYRIVEMLGRQVNEWNDMGRRA